MTMTFANQKLKFDVSKIERFFLSISLFPANSSQQINILSKVCPCADMAFL